MLDLLLGEVPGFFAAGEIVRLWDRGMIDRSRCGCGKEVPDCDVWASIVARAALHPGARAALATGDGGIDPARVAAWQNGVLRATAAPRLLRAAAATRAGHRRAWPELACYAEVMGALYQSVADCMGARVIVDSSKWPTAPGVLGLIPGVEPWVLHLVRDPRAVAYSWQRTKPLPDRGLDAVMRRRRATEAALRWIAKNLGTEIARTRLPADRYLRLRYEDLAADPQAALSAVVRFAGQDPAGVDLFEDGVALLGTNHTVAGNPVRLDAGSVTIRVDDDWRGGLERRDLIATTALTAPLLPRYGYPIRPARRGPKTR